MQTRPQKEYSIWMGRMKDARPNEVPTTTTTTTTTSTTTTTTAAAATTNS